jgi:hypothetical protein
MREEIIEKLKTKFPEYKERIENQSYFSQRDVQTFQKFKNKLAKFREKQNEVEVLKKPIR